MSQDMLPAGDGILIAVLFCCAEQYSIAEYFQLQEFCKPTFPAPKFRIGAVKPFFSAN